MIGNRNAPAQRSSGSPWFWLLWLAIPLIAGYFLAAWFIPAPRIGIVRVEGDIYDEMADYVVDQLNYASNDPAVRAVVLKVNSPGGGVTASENLYYSILNFREHKPLVVSIDTLAASGGYYAASAGDVIFAKPSSSIGNIGVVSLLPAPSYVDEELITTGPFKLFGSSRAAYVREMEILKQGFLGAVLTQRSERLQVSKQELARGEVYVGVLAKDLGLIDSLGTLNDAAAKAAELAKVANYQLLDLATIPGLEPPEPPPFMFGGDKSTVPGGGGGGVRPPGLYYRTVSEAEVIL